jgi:hypothetical protein
MHEADAEQGVFAGAGGFEQMPVVGLHVPTVWHPSLAAHVTALVPVQVPLTQLYVSHKFGLVTVHDPPVTGVEAVHNPLPDWHVPGVLHALAEHVTGFEPVQTPAWHVYVCSHSFEPGQLVPFATGV